MSRAQLTSTDQQNSGGPVSPFVAGKNKIINGDFGIWQRGTSFTITSGGGTYTADRWRADQDGSGYTKIISQQAFTAGNPITGYEPTYFTRINQSVAGSGQTFNIIGQFVEDVRVFAGQTVTFSFWAKAASATTIGWGYGQEFGTGGSSAYFDDEPYNISLTTSWQRFSFTRTVQSVSGKTIGAGSHLNMYIRLPLSATYTVDTWGWQMEAGSAVTPFTTASGTVQGELAACKRYTKSISSANPLWMVLIYLSGYGNSYSQTVYFDVPMRTTPTITCTDNAGTSGKITGYTTSGTLTNALVPSFVFEYDNSGNAVGLRTSVSGNYPYAEVYNVIISAEL